MKIKGTVHSNSKNVGELFLAAKRYHQRNLIELKDTENKNRKNLANRILGLKKKIYLREKKKAKTKAYSEIAKLLLNAKENYKSSLNKATLDCIQIIESICFEIIEEEIFTNSNIIKDKVKNEILKLENREYKIYINPSDVVSIKNEVSSNYCEDENIPKGVAIIKTESGSIEINWREHLKEIINRLKEEND